MRSKKKKKKTIEGGDDWKKKKEKRGRFALVFAPFPSPVSLHFAHRHRSACPLHAHAINNEEEGLQLFKKRKRT